jgi:hypothetical protein
MFLAGTGWVIGEDAAAGGAAGAGDWAGCASAAAESASSATTAAEARWLDRIDLIESFLRSVVRDLGRVAAVAHDLGADLDQLLAQAGQRPRLRRLRHRQRPHEIAEIGAAQSSL